MSTPAKDTATPAIDADRPLPDEAIAGRVVEDVAPAKSRRRSRSGTSGAERARRAKASGDKPPRTRTIRRDPIGKRMAGLYTTAGVGMVMASQATGNPALTGAGTAMVEQAEACGKAWEALAKDNPRVADALERMLTVSTAGALLAAHVPIALAAAGAAGILPPGMAGMATGEAPAAPAA